ncbi:helix-turn-helix domain-containing protein [Tenacibaculum piscium]|uniref:helix-turn-helix domain-containing protein n=1 Tax=Tenacibaculum piscium TaxID=1458515 RepID=UPI00187B3FEC|nr:helix-turn-helix transcriptional regulator [Tenacibaculum piscium]MBE7686120.1 helix-turn-helix domain-containing protein [Tenacibaculum piscium]MBE7691011.1 helix-turn-helix domain-containing protein [Tenacibaculum piscium]
MDDILTRLKKIISHYNLTSSTFADAINVQRSSISHLLSGRNKPSLDFVMKTINKFPEVDLYWFLYGEGTFPKIEPEEEIVAEEETSTKEIIQEEKKEISPTLFSTSTTSIENNSKNEPNNSGNKKLVKIVLLYDDGSFNEFNQ